MVFAAIAVAEGAAEIFARFSGSVVLTEVGQFETPISLVARPGTQDLFLGERPGRVKLIKIASDGSLVEASQVLDITDQVTTKGEGGLLGLAFSPTGDELYISYTHKNSESRIDSYAMHADGPVPETQRLLLAVHQPYSGHNGGHLLADPLGRLLIGFGDGGYRGEPRFTEEDRSTDPTPLDLSGDPHGHGQNRSTLLGALVRILPSPNGELPYSIPPENPFVHDKTAGIRPEILAFGFRNPWRFDLDPVTGDLWIADVGRLEAEEINYLQADDLSTGANFGWSAMEGTSEYRGPEPDGHVPPIHEYRHINEGLVAPCSVIGGVVIRGADLPGLDGAYLFSDYCDGRIRALQPNDSGGWETRVLGTPVELPVSFTRSNDGTIYVVSLYGGVYRLDAK